MADDPVSRATADELVHVDLFRTATGGRLHVRQCPHLLDKEVVPATADDLRSHEVCAMCRNELAGEGRTEHESIDAALEDIGASRQNGTELARLLGAEDFDAIHVPYSRSYVAVTRCGRAVGGPARRTSAMPTGTWCGSRTTRLAVAADPRAPRSMGTDVCPNCFTRKVGQRFVLV